MPQKHRSNGGMPFLNTGQTGPRLSNTGQRARSKQHGSEGQV